MLDCLVVCPPLSISFPHQVPRHPPLLALYMLGCLRRAKLEGAMVDLYHRGGDFGADLREATRQGARMVVLVVGDYTRPLPPSSVPTAADRLRLLLPDTPIVLAGSVTADAARQALATNPRLDAATWGESEAVVEDLARAAAAGDDWRAVPGVVSRQDGQLVTGPPHPGIADLDELPYPAWDLVDWRFYGGTAHRHRNEPFFRVVGMRGCPYGCVFCNSKNAFISRATIRKRRPQAIVDELRWLVERFGAREFQFTESVTNLDEEHVEGLCHAMLEAELGVPWTCHVRIDKTSREQLALMARAGCWNVLFGVESNDPEIIRHVSKGITPQQATDTVRWAREAGITTTASFMFGLPGETPDKARATMDFALRLDPDFAQFFTTKIYREGLIPPELGQRLPEWEYSVHDLYGPPFLPAAYDSIEQLHALRREAYRRFYTRPGYVARQLGDMLRNGEALRAVHAAGSMMKLLRR